MSVERAAQILNQRAAQREAGAVSQTYHEDADGTIHIQTHQDVGPALEYAKQCRRAEAEGRGRFGKRGDFHRTMSTPFNIYYAACQKLGIPLRKIFDKEVAQRIDKELKSEFPAFKTTNDKHI